MTEASFPQMLLKAEIAAARIEGALMSDPALATLWRAEVALTEAAASVGMEDVRIRPSDLLARVAGNGIAGGPDPAAGELALGLLRALKSPGDILRAPETVLRRFERIAAGPQPDPGEEDGARLNAVEAGKIVARQAETVSPILEACRIAGRYATLTARQSPMVERLVMVAAESALRREALGRAGMARAPVGGDRPDDPLDGPLRGLAAPVSADWIALPSLALTRGRFAIWSPGGAAGVQGLISAMGDSLARELGRIGALRGWILQARELAGEKHGRSRLADALALFMVAPLQGSGSMAARLGMTQRGVLNVLDRLVGTGLIREVTGRRAARLWATPGIAARLDRGGRLPGQSPPRFLARGGISAPVAQDIGLAQVGPQSDLPDARSAEEALDRVFADLDRAMGQADALLPHRTRNPEREVD